MTRSITGHDGPHLVLRAVYTMCQGLAVIGMDNGARQGIFPAMNPFEEPADLAMAVIVRRNNVVQLKSGRKYVANKEHELPEGATIAAEEPHGDNDFSYLCGLEYCRCHA